MQDVHYCEANLPEDMQTVELVVFSDLHVGDPRFNQPLFEEIRAWVLAEPNRFCLLNGDLMNAATRDSVSDVYGDTMNPRDQLRWLKREFEPLRDRILAITEGNHEARITRSTSIRVMEELADHLGMVDKFFPEGVIIKLTHGRKDNQKRAAHMIYMTHGASGATLQGGKALAMGRMANAVLAEVYICGHTHWPAAFRERILVPDPYNNVVRAVDQLFVNSGSLVEWGGYAQVKGFKPGAQGSPHIRLTAEPKKAVAVV